MAKVPMPERAFPRGGVKTKRKVAHDADFSLFKRKKSKEAVKSKRSNKPSAVVDTALQADVVTDLEIRDVRPGMNILGCIDNITQLNVELSLPGGIRAKVQGTNINEQYTAMIKDNYSTLPALSEIFEIGDHFPVSIISKFTEGSTSKQFLASLNPKDVNAKLTPPHLRKSLTLIGSVVGVEDHGVVLDVGITNVTAFMPFKSARSDCVYKKSQLVHIQITSVMSEGHAIHVADVRTGKMLTAVNDGQPLHCFLPGIRWSLIVTKILKSGIQVGLKGFGPEMTGFIHVSHLNKLFDKVSNYEIGMELQGTLLYFLPVLNYAFFQSSSLVRPKWSLSYGDLVKNVRIVRVTTNGVVGKIKEGEGSDSEKCFIPIKRMDDYQLFVRGVKKVMTTFAVGSILPEVRLEWPSRMSRYYFGAIDKESLKEQPYSKGDLKVGQLVKCVLSIVGEKYNTVEIAHTLKGFVAHEHMTDKPGISEGKSFKPGRAFTGRVLSLGDDGDRVKVTLKKSLVRAERILTAATKIKSGDSYPGFVRHVFPHRIIVEFFGGMQADIPRERLPVPRSASLSSAYKVGQVVNCYVIKAEVKEDTTQDEEEGKEKKEKLLFSLTYNPVVDSRVTVGFKYPAEVVSASDDGLYLTVEVGPKTTIYGFLPKYMISSYEEIASQWLKVTQPRTKLMVICVHIDPLVQPSIIFAVHPALTSFYKKYKLELKKGVNLMKKNQMVPLLVLPSGDKQVFVPAFPHSASLKPLQIRQKGVFKDYQIVVGKLIRVKRKAFQCISHLALLWDHDYLSSLELLADYLSECEDLQTRVNSVKLHPLCWRFLGEILEAIVERVDDGVSTLSFLTSRIRFTGKCQATLNPGAQVHCRIVWIDYSGEVAWVHTLPESNLETSHEHRPTLRARIVYTGANVVVAEATGSHELVFIPTLRYMNDKSISHGYAVGRKARLCVHRLRSKLYGIDSFVALNRDLPSRNKDEPSTKKIKLRDGKASSKKEKDASEKEEPDVFVEYVKEGVQTDGIQEIKLEQFSDEEMERLAEKECDKTIELDEDSDAEIKMECDSRDGMEVNGKLSDSSDIEDDDDDVKTEPVDFEVGFDWSVAENPDLLKGALSKAVAQDSSSDEEEEDKSEKKKKKRLTGSEKREKAREAEERLRAREEALVDPTRPPQSADDFDRLTVSTPDDSSVWLKYMAFHLENTEIEKARAVARRALKVISFREEQEKLNVWLALLNLEQLYGTAESQKDTLEEALRCNEPYKIHVHKLNALVDSSAGLQAEQLANVMLKKYGENEEVWCEVGGALMRLGKLDFARKVLQRGMSSLPATKHVSLITRFAQLENKYGSNERAQTLYENVITLFPKRVDVWSAYVDLLVKIGNIDFARTTLERSVSQSLPPKKMKVLFKKFLTFEETHGTPENAEKVRQAAAEYVESVGSND